MTNVNKDSENYCYFDSGCKEASQFLKKQSSCLNCPFNECLYENSKWHKKQIREMNLKLNEV